MTEGTRELITRLLERERSQALRVAREAAWWVRHYRESAPGSVPGAEHRLRSAEAGLTAANGALLEWVRFAGRAGKEAARGG